MIRENMKMSDEKKSFTKANGFPFLLKPAVKHCLWGGSKIGETYGKLEKENRKFCEDIGETWECSTNEEGISVVASGKYEGWLLTEVLKNHPEFLGKWQNEKGELPILIKLIDAKKDLSIQVHPGDEYAKEHENGALGKTELWYVLDAEEDSRLIYGFEHDMEKSRVEKSLMDGTIERYVKKIPVRKDDHFFIEAGTLHGIGKGILLAEIQENSNITYRLHDYNRVDKHGNRREVHIEKGLNVLKLTHAMDVKHGPRQLHYKKGFAIQKVCQNQYFQVEKLILNTQCCREMAELQRMEESFRVLLCTEGCGVLFVKNELLSFFKGDCIFVPANTEQMKLHGKAELLCCRA